MSEGSREYRIREEDGTFSDADLHKGMVDNEDANRWASQQTGQRVVDEGIMSVEEAMKFYGYIPKPKT